MLSNRSFIVLHFMLRSVIHYELGFCEGCKACIWILSFSGTWWPTSALSECRKDSAPLCCLCCFVKDQLMFTWVCVWAFSSVLFHWSICPFFGQHHTVFFLPLWIILIVYGSAGSSLVWVGFLSLWQEGAALGCSVRASHWGGFSCCGAWALGRAGSSGGSTWAQ